MATFLSMTETSKKDEVALKQILCIYYLLRFWKNTADTKGLIDSDSEVNAITPAYTSKLGFWARYTTVGAQKINGSTLKIFEIVLASLQMEDKLRKARFF